MITELSKEGTMGGKVQSPNYEEVRTYVARRVAEGFDSEEDILEDALECFEDEFGESVELTQTISKMVSELMAQHLADERSWDSETDCDRLDKAFTELEDNGIVARQNFTCCQTCGHAEIWDEVDQLKQDLEQANKSIGPQGYVFYHMQDTELAVEDGMLYLAFGATENADDADIRVAQRVSEILRKYGFNVNWNGTLDSRICVTGINWRRRRLVAC